MPITKHGIEFFGYVDHPETDILKIDFCAFKIYSLAGLEIQSESTPPLSELVEFGKNCAVVVSNSLNNAAMKLTGENFIDSDETDWHKERGTRPPFLIILFKESNPRVLKGGYRQTYNSDLLLHDAFPGVETEISSWEEKNLPNIIASLTISLSSFNGSVTIRPIESIIFGVTTSGQKVLNHTIAFSADISTTSRKPLGDIASKVQESKFLYTKLEPDTCKHLFLAMNETDRLKQFLNYFLFIERYTHSQFAKIKNDDNHTRLFNNPPRLKLKGLEFFSGQLDLAKNLKQRFQWCALLQWENLDDSDIECFERVKKIRDGISHGDSIDPKSLPIESIKSLSHKLLLSGL
jgi:hypothetical protein